jgi:predicted HNH restriction endonuclease
MGKKLLTTPRSRVRSAVRQLFLRSRERAACLKRDRNSCQSCGVKASVAKGREQKVQVHHIQAGGIGNWEAVIDMIFAEILCNPDFMTTLCPDCHEKIHKQATADAKILEDTCI